MELSILKKITEQYFSITLKREIYFKKATFWGFRQTYTNINKNIGCAGEGRQEQPGLSLTRDMGASQALLVLPVPQVLWVEAPNQGVPLFHMHTGDCYCCFKQTFLLRHLAKALNIFPLPS